jgi:hypothetical protein
MKMEKKKLSAAMAAVYAYIKTSEEAMAYAAMQDSEAAAGMSPADNRPYNTWGIVGRQNQMQANSMMQMRVFK